MLVTRLGFGFGPRGLCLMTISSSFNMVVFASTRSRAAACLARSSLTRAMRSSRVIDDRLLRGGSATTSNISSSSPYGFWISFMSGRLSPFKALSASDGLPSIIVEPPRLGEGDNGDFNPLDAREARSLEAGLPKLLSSADLPTSHSWRRPRISVPIDSYCARRLASNPPVSARSRLALDSSRMTCIFACSARIPWERALSLRYCERRLSLLGGAVGSGDGGITSPTN